MIKAIIVNFPTNLGDAILALPVLDRLRTNYLKAKITAIVSPRTKDFFLRNNFIDEVILFDKQWPAKQKLLFSFSLRGKYDLFIDLKNSFLPIISGAKKKTPMLRFFPKNLHIKEKYLLLIKRFGKLKSTKKCQFILTKSEKKQWEQLNLKPSFFIACSSLSPMKSYPYDLLKKLLKKISGKYSVVVLGEKRDRSFYKDILSLRDVIDLVGKTRMVDVFYLLKNYARILLGVDSSVLHLGSYLNIPIIAIFGPTHPKRSLPYSEKSLVITNQHLSCLHCEKGDCNLRNECMKIDPDRITKAIEQLW